MTLHQGPALALNKFLRYRYICYAASNIGREEKHTGILHSSLLSQKPMTINPGIHVNANKMHKNTANFRPLPHTAQTLMAKMTKGLWIRECEKMNK